MKKKRSTRFLSDGRLMLNLGCGSRMNWRWNNLDFSPIAILAHHKLIAKSLKRIGFLEVERYERLLKVDPEIIVWDLRKGIPFDDETFDTVYHSHLLEHIDREFAPSFLRECYRVLKSGGILRAVVPDLQIIVNNYVSSVSKLETGHRLALVDHQRSTNKLFAQMVRKEPSGIIKQPPFVRIVERFLRRDATKAGEIHHWMYDRYSLSDLLLSVGFRDIQVEQPSTSRIKNWSHFNLDTNEDASIHAPDSLYVEGVKIL